MGCKFSIDMDKMSIGFVIRIIMALTSVLGAHLVRGATGQHDVNTRSRSTNNGTVEAEIELKSDGKHFILKPQSFDYIPHVVRAPRSTFGHAWPKPRQMTSNPRKLYHFTESSFIFTPIGPRCDIITNALKRYTSIIKNTSMPLFKDNILNSQFYTTRVDKDLPTALDWTRSVPLKYVAVEYRHCAEYPTLNSDESYVISINSSGAQLRANEVWGALRGLETFSQIIIQGPGNKLYVRESQIHDRPRFPHRGVMLDTGRHYIYPSVIKDVLEGMSYNKMNILHWHIVDDQSFPFESHVHPELSRKGAFHPTMVYTHADVKDIIEYARMRGIRVIPEFDTPGHTISWGLGYPEIKAECASPGGQGPINPIKNATWPFMEELFGEIMGLFPDTFLHLGGDEVMSPCWASDAIIQKYMKRTNPSIRIQAGKLFNKEVEAIYFEKLITRLNQLSYTRKQGASYIVWDEAASQKLKSAAGNHTVISHIWMADSSVVRQRVEAGYQTIFSSCWYLDMIQRGPQWTKYYTCEPSPYNTEREEQGKLLGGEACLWGEYIDNEFLMARLWPYASAAAERLWSSKDVRDVNAAGPRMQEHRCRMLRRGLSVGNAGGPDYCPRTDLNFKTKVDREHSRDLPYHTTTDQTERFTKQNRTSRNVWIYIRTEDRLMIVAICAIQGLVGLLIFWKLKKSGFCRQRC